MVEINWLEIPVLDLNRARQFYRNVLEFEIDEVNIDGDDQLIFTAANIRGMIYQSEQVNNGITLFFHVNRMSEYLERVTDFGGIVLQQKTLIKNISTDGSAITNTYFDGKTGYFAKVEDSEGNVLGLHSNS